MVVPARRAKTQANTPGFGAPISRAAGLLATKCGARSVPARVVGAESFGVRCHPVAAVAAKLTEERRRGLGRAVRKSVPERMVRRIIRKGAASASTGVLPAGDTITTERPPRREAART